MSDDMLSVSNTSSADAALFSVDRPSGGTEAAEEAPRLLAVTDGSAGEPADPGISARSLLVRGTEPFTRATAPRSPLETILGEDERARILDTEAVPWRMICALKIHGAKTFIGTGWFAGPRTIITAGHCAFHPDMGGWAKEIRIFPARDGKRKPFLELKSERFSTTNRWLTSLAPDFDYAAIHLGEDALPITAETGWFSAAVYNDAALASQRVNVSGYPSDKGIAELVGTEQWFHAKQILHTTPDRIYYDVDTRDGQSGAPVWIETDEGPRVVGIHAYGLRGSSPLGLTANSAPRITEAVLNLIRDWVSRT